MAGNLIRCAGIFVIALTLQLPLSGQTIESDSARAEQARRNGERLPAQDQVSGIMGSMIRDEVPSSPGDPDLGEQVILKKREKPTPFSIAADVSGFYTTNAALTDVAEEDDFFLVGQVAASYQPRLANALFGEITVRQSAYRYSKLDELDFESFNIGAGVTYVAQPLWGLAFSARYNFNRLTDGSEHDEFFKNQTLTLGVLKVFELSKAHSVYAGYSTIFGWSDPVAPQRDEHGLFIGYRANLTRSISLDLYYRVALFDYAGSRDDWNHNFFAAVKWSLTEWLSVSLSATAGLNNSDRDVFDYEVFNFGPTIAVSFVF